MLLPHLMNFQAGMAPDVAWRFNSYVPNSYGRSILDTWNPQQSCAYGALKTSKGIFQPPINRWLDEPIDMSADRTYCPTYVAINSRVASSLTTTNPAAVVEIPFKNKTTNWQYTLYVRVEKMEPTAPSVTKLRPVRR